MGIGIDLGGTTIKGGIVNDQGKILHERSLKTASQRGYAHVLKDLIGLIDELLLLSPDEKALGIGIPGILSGDGGTIVSCPNLQWKNVPLKKDLVTVLKRDLLLVNDATAACIAEAAFGSTVGRADSVMITLGTGVGGGVIINNRIVSGAHGVASEIGHMQMEENFYSCSCGKNGCLETFSSVTALIRYCKMRLETGAESALLSEHELDGKSIIVAAQAGDILALEAVNRLARYLGRAIAIISDVIDPEIYTIGGGLSNAGNFLLEKIKAETGKHITYPEHAVPEIVLATFRNEAGIIGAASLKDYV